MNRVKGGYRQVCFIKGLSHISLLAYSRFPNVHVNSCVLFYQSNIPLHLKLIFALFHCKNTNSEEKILNSLSLPFLVALYDLLWNSGNILSIWLQRVAMSCFPTFTSYLHIQPFTNVKTNYIFPFSIQHKDECLPQNPLLLAKFSSKHHCD